MKEEVEEIKKELSEVKEKSLAMELLEDERKSVKRLFIIWIITFVAFLCLLGYTIYLLNDIQTIKTTTQEITDFENISGGIVNRGDIYGEN